MSNLPVSMCDHKRRAVNNWLHNALEDMTTTVRDFIDNDGEVYARNANAMQSVLHTDCAVCFPKKESNE